MKHFIPLLLITFLGYGKSVADSTTTSVAPKLTLSAYVDVYYGYDFSNPATHERPAFLYNHTRHNEFNLNLGYIKAGYQAERLRANLALMAGTYAQYNMAAEPGMLKNIYEANAGIKLSSKHDLWIDAGVFASHIGHESAVSKDCWTLTRSLSAENTPYFESGAKLTYTTTNQKWLFSGLVLNGWQRIQRVDGNNTPAFGTQVLFRPSSRVTINSSTFIGNDKPDSVKQMRYFHNLYGIFHLTKRLGLITAFDIGIEQKNKGSQQYNLWYNPATTIRYAFANKYAAAVRAEYYHDRNGAIINSGTANGFQTFGYSLNIDYNPLPNVLVRLEGRMFGSKDKIFVLDKQPSQQNYSLVSSIAVSF